MFQLQRILVPIDFSDRSVAAAEHAALIAAHFDAGLIFFHAIPPGPYEHGVFEHGFTPSSVWPSRDEIEGKLQRLLDELAERVAGKRRSEQVLVWGDPAAEIEKAAEQSNANLIVMPTHGYGPFRRYILGSVTAKVLHDLRTPVLTGAHVQELPLTTADPYRRIACAIDRKEHSGAVLEWASCFARAMKAEFHVIHAAPLIEETMPELEHPLPPDLPDRVRESLEEQVRKDLQSAGVRADKLHVQNEHVSSFVTDVVSREKIDLLVIGRSADDSLAGRLRTHSYALIRESDIPVVSI